MDQLRTGQLNRHANDLSVCLRRRTDSNEVSCYSERKDGPLQVLLVNHRADLIRNGRHMLLELLWVPPREGFHALECVEVQLPMRLLKQIVEGRQEPRQVREWN